MFAPSVMTPSASFSLPGSIPDDRHIPHRRHPSLSWRAEAGLPPPPSEIDHYTNLQHALVSSYPDSPSPSAYDMRLGGQEEGDERVQGNAVSKHPKLKLKIMLAGNLFEAGGSISGALEVTSSTSQRLRLGEIAIELEAFEELTSRDHSATQIFLFNRTLFQGEHLPPSNAVLPAAPVHGHWTARKGRTSFPFSFRLPSDAPSSINFAGNAQLRYALKGTVQTWWNETKSIVTVRSDALVVEKWHDEFDPRYLEPLETVADTHIFMGGSGAVWLEAGMAEQLFVAGGMVKIRAGIKNNTKRHISGIKVAIAKRLIFPVCGLPGTPAQRPSLEPQITEVVHTQMFKGPSFEFPPNEEVVTNLAVDLPKELRTIRKTRLFEVQIVALVSAQMGNFAKDLTVEMPIYVAHSGSLQHAVVSALDPLRRLPQRSRSAMSQHGHHNQPHLHPNLYLHSNAQTHFDGPPMSPVEGYGVERGWSPAPLGSGAMGSPSRPSSAAPNMGGGHASPWGQIADPFAFIPGQRGQTPQVSLDPNTLTLLQNLPIRPVSAQEQTRGRADEHPRQAMAESAHNSSGLHGLDSPQPQKSHQSSVSAIPSPSPSQSSQQQQRQKQQQQNQQQLVAPSPNTITMSQLLNLGAVPVAGLATIEEDSESAAGTVRSIRTLVGSVDRNNIAQFEAQAHKAQKEEDEEREKRELERGIRIPEEAVDKTLPKPPIPSAKASAPTSRPRVSELFTIPPAQQIISSQVEMVSSASKVDRDTSVIVTPARPLSAQGHGLMALESRLGNQRQGSVQEAALQEVINTQSNVQSYSKHSKPTIQRRTSTTETGALRAAAAMALQRKAEQEAKERETLRQSQVNMNEAKEEAIFEAERQKEAQTLDLAREEKEQTVAAYKNVSNGGERTIPKSSSSGNREGRGERKEVDIQEQKKLNKAAVGRVAGWISSSPINSRGLGENDAEDPALSPKTPSSSVLREMDDDQVVKPTQTPFTSNKQVQGLHTSKDETPTLSAGLRALIDSSNARPVPKQGTAIRSHIGSRRFSEGADQSEIKSKPSTLEKPNLSQSKKDIPTEASQGVPSVRSAAATSPQANQKEASKNSLAVTVETGGEGKKYDVRSARGGKGGRVASVASMWASIANGTDGSQIKNDDTPVLTLRPKAFRSGVVGSSVLDFSKTKNEEVKKPTAMQIFSLQQLPLPNANEGARGLPLKTTKAANFVNTTMPKPVFVKLPSPTSPSAEQLRLTRKITIEKEEPLMPPGQLKESRKLASDLIAKEAKLKAGRDLQIDGDADAVLPMNGRGSTKPIGRDKLANLRSMWGS